MTLDITFGKLVLLDEEYGHDFVLDGLDETHSYVERCPDADEDICDPAHTFCPRQSYRSGSYCSFPAFVQKYLPRMYNEMQVSGIAKLSRYYDEIQALLDRPNKTNPHDKVAVALDRDRIKWFKYWSKKAKELYGDEAGVMFS